MIKLKYGPSVFFSPSSFVGRAAVVNTFPFRFPNSDGSYTVPNSSFLIFCHVKKQSTISHCYWVKSYREYAWTETKIIGPLQIDFLYLYCKRHILVSLHYHQKHDANPVLLKFLVYVNISNCDSLAEHNFSVSFNWIPKRKIFHL